MILFVLAYLGGVLTILSPCVLPILPFTFARADQPFRTSGTVTDHRLFQLVRQKGSIVDRTFTIEFLDAGAQVFAFTFG